MYLWVSNGYVALKKVPHDEFDTAALNILRAHYEDEKVHITDVDDIVQRLHTDIMRLIHMHEFIILSSLFKYLALIEQSDRWKIGGD